jgi:hypothetical protein
LISDHDAAKDAAIHVIEYLAQYLQVQKFSYSINLLLPFRVQNLDLVNHILLLDHKLGNLVGD